MLAALALLIAWYARNIESKQSAASPATEAARTQTFLFSTRPIDRGEIIAPEDIAARPVQAAHPPAKGLRNPSDAIGRMALEPIAAGAAIRASHITADPVAGIAKRIPVGHRAYALAISEKDISGGLLQAGDRVDLFVTLPSALFAEKGGTGKTVDDQSKGMLLLENIDVLAVGTQTQAGDDPNTAARTVTLAIQAEALPKVALAARLGGISLAIRNPSDRQRPVMPLADLAALEPYRVPEKKKPVGRPPSVPAIAVYSGKDRSVVRTP